MKEGLCMKDVLEAQQRMAPDSRDSTLKGS